MDALWNDAVICKPPASMTSSWASASAAQQAKTPKTQNFNAFLKTPLQDSCNIRSRTSERVRGHAEVEKLERAWPARKAGVASKDRVLDSMRYLPASKRTDACT